MIVPGFGDSQNMYVKKRNKLGTKEWMNVGEFRLEMGVPGCWEGTRNS